MAEQKTRENKKGNEINSYHILEKENPEFGRMEEDRAGTFATGNGTNIFVPGKSINNRVVKFHEMGHAMGNSHLNDRAMSEYGGSSYIGPRQFWRNFIKCWNCKR